MRQWILRKLRRPRLPERLANYRKAWQQGWEDRKLLGAGVITQLSQEYDDEESQLGYLDAIEDRWNPPVV